MQQCCKDIKWFHDSIPATNDNTIPSSLRDMCLKSLLLGRSRDLRAGTEAKIFSSDTGAISIGYGLHKGRRAQTAGHIRRQEGC